VWIPENVVLRANLLRKNYDDLIGGHYGIDKTVYLLRMKYYWLYMKRDATEYIRRCAAC
jgi:hypothetical protein